MTAAQQQVKNKVGAAGVHVFLNLNKQHFAQILPHFILGQECAFFSIGSTDYGIELKAEKVQIYILEEFQYFPVKGPVVYRILKTLLKAHKKGENVAV